MKPWLSIAALNGALAVIAGAFAAHGLKAVISPDMLAVFQTGVHYQMAHALALGLTSFVMTGAAAGRARWAARLFLTGIVLFSGSLYALALTGVRMLGIITPFGGVAFIAGWLMLALAGLKREG